MGSSKKNKIKARAAAAAGDAGAGTAGRPASGAQGASRTSRDLPVVAPPAGFWRWLAPLLVFIAAILPFTRAFDYGFVDLDDDRNFTAQWNPWFNADHHDLSAERLEWMFTSSHLGHYQPLAWVSLALDAALAGRFDARDFHRTNVILHALVAAALYVLALALLAWGFGRPRTPTPRLRIAAAFVALAWAVHPLRVESVAWITERRDALSCGFLVLSVLAYVRSVERPASRGPWLAAALACYVLSLLSKAWGITLPLVLLCLDLWPLRRSRPTAQGGGASSLTFLVREKLWFAPLALLAAWLAARAQGDTSALMSLTDHSLAQRAAQAAYGLVFYVVKSAWPVALSPLYVLELQVDTAAPVYVASELAVVAVTIGAFATRRRWPALWTTWATYAILVSPVLGFLQSGSQKVADRYTYVAAIPLTLLAGAALARAMGETAAGAGADAERNAARARPRWIAGVALATGALCALAWGARAQTAVWRDSESVFARMVEVEPNNYFGQHCLSVILGGQGRLEEAVDHARRSVAAHPYEGNVDARYNLGYLLQRLGREDEAMGAWREANQVAPDHRLSLVRLTTALMSKGRTDEARALVEDSVRRAPRFLEGYAQLAQLEYAQGHRERTIEAWKRALAVDPGWPPANHALGFAALEDGDGATAETYVRRALERGLDAEMLIDLGRAYRLQGRAQEALSCFEHVLSLQPQNARARAERDATRGSGPGR